MHERNSPFEMYQKHQNEASQSFCYTCHVLGKVTIFILLYKFVFFCILHLTLNQTLTLFLILTISLIQTLILTLKV